MSDLFKETNSARTDFCVINTNSMKAYTIFDVRSITDEQGMHQYRQQVMETVEEHGGRYVAIGGPLEVIEGKETPVFPVIIEFPDMNAARSWYTSPRYSGLKELRKRSAETHAYLLQSILP